MIYPLYNLLHSDSIIKMPVDRSNIMFTSCYNTVLTFILKNDIHIKNGSK